MQVLVAMARRRGAVLSRSDLIAQCWNGRAVGDDAVHRSMSILRGVARKLGGFSIETIKRVGYTLNAADDGLVAAVQDADSGAPAIAVLPFVNISADPEQAYFSDGLTEEFICQLSQLSGVRVAGRTPASAAKDKHRDLQEIGRELGVGYVLRGSVRKAGERLRISAHVVDCATGFDLWSETFDRKLDDVFAIQDEVAAALCAALSLTLGTGGARPDYGGTRNFEAYDHFLKAGRTWQHLGPDELDVRAAHLRQALMIDSRYGLAWASLACLLTQRRGFSPATDAERLDQEKANAAQRARELSPELPEAHIAQCCVEAHKRNWLIADAHGMRAVRRGPGHRPQTQHLVGGFLSSTGRTQAGLPYRLAARDYDPLSMGFSALVLSAYMALEDWPAFEAEYARNRELEGPRGNVEAQRLAQLLAAGAGTQAIKAQYGHILETDAASSQFQALAAVHGTAGVRDVLERSRDQSVPVHCYFFGNLAGLYGHDDLALEALLRAAPRGPSGMLQMCWYPGFRASRQAPEFKALMRHVGLLDFWRTSGKWPDRARPLGTDDVEFF